MLQTRRLIALVGAALASAVTTASADTTSLRAVVGIGGEVELDNTEEDLATTYGFDLVFMHDLHPHFGFGAALGANWWQGEGAAEDAERNLFVDVSLRPEGRFDLGTFQLFAAGALGVTYSSIGDDEFPGGDIDPAFGYNLGLEVGGRFRVGDGGGIEVGLGVLHRGAEHEIDTILGSTEVDGTVTDILLRLGGFFTL